MGVISYSAHSVFQHTFAFFGTCVLCYLPCHAFFFAFHGFHASVSQAACITFLDWVYGCSLFSCVTLRSSCSISFSPVLCHSHFVFYVFHLLLFRFYACDLFFSWQMMTTITRSGGVSLDTWVSGFQWRFMVHSLGFGLD
jgi:hypothetical protein